jgi:2-dehydropantoate 2-reductase
MDAASIRYAVIGAGAIGSALAARLAAAGRDVMLVARGARADDLKAHGIRLLEGGETFDARPTIAAIADVRDADVIFVTVKSQALPEVLKSLAPLVSPSARIIPMVNGIPFWYFMDGDAPCRAVESVDPGGDLVARFAPGQIIGAVVYTTAALEDANVARIFTRQKFTLGAVGMQPDTRVDAIARDLTDAGLDVAENPVIRNEVWTKVALNLATNPLSVVSEAGLEAMFTDPPLLGIVQACLDETWAIAGHYGATPTMPRDVMIALGRKGGSFQTSMLKDYLAGRPLELAAIYESVAELAAAAGMALPMAASIAEQARAKASSLPLSA